MPDFYTWLDLWMKHGEMLARVELLTALKKQD